MEDPTCVHQITLEYKNTVRFLHGNTQTKGITECQSQTEFLMRVWKPRKLFEIGFNLCNVMKKYCIIHSLDGGGF